MQLSHSWTLLVSIFWGNDFQSTDWFSCCGLWLSLSSASLRETDVKASHSGIKQALKYANVSLSNLGHTHDDDMMSLLLQIPENAESIWLLCFSLSPLAESFLVLMILAAYSWPVQSLTQRRTTEKAPLGKKKDRKQGVRGCCISLVSINRDIIAVQLTSLSFWTLLCLI